MVDHETALPGRLGMRVSFKAILMLLLIATVLGVLSAGDNVHGLDLRFAQWIQQWEGAWGKALYRVGDMLGTTSLAAIATVIAFTFALVKKRWRLAVFLALVLVLRLGGTQLKPLFVSPRPTAEHLRLLETFDGTGYPSGHSMTVAMVASIAVLIAWNYVQVSGIRWGVMVLAVSATILVGWSRIWSGAHWPTDVLGGWSYGIALTLLAWKLSDFLLTAAAITRDGAPKSATR